MRDEYEGMSQQNVQWTIADILLKKQFAEVSIIDIDKCTYFTYFFIEYGKDVPLLHLCRDFPYEDQMQAKANQYIAPEEQSQFMQLVALDRIISRLNERDAYFFTMKGRSSDGKRHLYKHSYYYLDERKKTILTTLEDVTGIEEHDLLTGELNRHGFIREVDQILENCEDRKQYSILFFNIKGFKAINELFGVEGGDEVLRESVQLIRESALKPLAVARFEADHFVAMVRQDNLDYEEIVRICHRTFCYNGKDFKFYSRCGIYPINDTRHNVSGMCDRAKLAKEYITDDYVKPYAVYDQSMRKLFVQKKELTSDLLHALKHQEFEVYYQPIYETVTGRIASAEALVRWNHQNLGLIPPGEFIETFEENGYISELDLFVETHVKRFLLGRLNRGQIVVPVAINLSRMDFYDNRIMDQIMTDIREGEQLNPYIRLEITESAYSTIMENGCEYIRTIKDADVKILLDDFGCGYSSFSTMRDFDFDVLKLDMGFVQQIGINRKSESIISSIILMAHSLNMLVIAEGVETVQQRDFLKMNGCDYIQGYFYSKPLAEKEFVRLLEK